MKKKDKSRMAAKLPSGGRKKHGGYTYLVTGRLPEHRLRVERYLCAARKGLVADQGPTEEDLTTAQIILIDRVVMKLGVLRCIEEYVGENTVMEGKDVAPSLKASYLAYNNSTRLDLTVLGVHKRAGAKVMTEQEYLDNIDYGDKEEESEDVPTDKKAD